ncbi:MAG: Gluconolactonase [Polyangiaceae bacterium]|nr:Gluconolactonase [Polyangiaceae bacterium]
MKQLVLVLSSLLFACGSSEKPGPSNTGGSGAGAGAAGTPATAGTGPGTAGTSGSTAGGSSGNSATGGTAGSGGGVAGAGGNGGVGGGGGGTAGTAGTTTAGFKCPEGSSALTPTLPTSVPEGASPPGAGAGNNLEGPVWIAGALYVSEFPLTSVPMSRIFRYVPGVGFDAQPAISDAGTNGLAIDNAGSLLGGVHKDGSVSRFNLAAPTAAPTKLAFEYAFDAAMGEKRRFNSPNDLAVHSNGTIYFTDPDWQAPSTKPQGAERAYRVKDGVVQHLQGVTVTKPNGIVISVDESTLYIGGTNGLFKYPLNADGSVGTEKRIIAGEISGGVDGMTKDCAGHIYVTTGSNVVVLRKDDSVVGSITGINGVTNVAFGGADSRTLFITSMQPPRLREVALNVPGFPY